MTDDTLARIAAYLLADRRYRLLDHDDQTNVDHAAHFRQVEVAWKERERRWREIGEDAWREVEGWQR